MVHNLKLHFSAKNEEKKTHLSDQRKFISFSSASSQGFLPWGHITKLMSEDSIQAPDCVGTCQLTGKLRDAQLPQFKLTYHLEESQFCLPATSGRISLVDKLQLNSASWTKPATPYWLTSSKWKFPVKEHHDPWGMTWLTTLVCCIPPVPHQPSTSTPPESRLGLESNLSVGPTLRRSNIRRKLPTHQWKVLKSSPQPFTREENYWVFWGRITLATCLPWSLGCPNKSILEPGKFLIRQTFRQVGTSSTSHKGVWWWLDHWMNNAFAGDNSTSLPFVLSSWRSQDTRHCILDPTDSTTSLWLRLQVELRVRPNCFDSWSRFPATLCNWRPKDSSRISGDHSNLGKGLCFECQWKPRWILMKLEWAQESQW